MKIRLSNVQWCEIAYKFPLKDHTTKHAPNILTKK